MITRDQCAEHARAGTLASALLQPATPDATEDGLRYAIEIMKLDAALAYAFRRMAREGAR